MGKNWYKNKDDCWFPVFGLKNFNELNWRYVFFSEEESEEGQLYFCENEEKEDIAHSVFSLSSWGGWVDIIWSFRFDDMCDGYSLEYKYDIEYHRIIVKVKDYDGRIVDVYYFWMIPIEDESEWIWKDEKKDSDNE